MLKDMFVLQDQIVFVFITDVKGDVCYRIRLLLLWMLKDMFVL